MPQRTTTPEQITSEALLHKVAQGDGTAFRALVIRHQNHVFNLAYRILGDRQRSEDVAQEVFLKVWKTAKNYQQKSKVTTWLYRITVNLCLNEIKSQRRWSWLRYLHLSKTDEVETERQMDRSPTAEELVIAQELSHRITEALQALPENQRIALILRRYDGLSYQEISGVLDCSVSAVEALLVRAKRTVQAFLEKIKKFK
jgi:RNA polymerase sigma-70 factor, ECF subfamily